MLLTDSGHTGCSQFKAMVEAQGYSISQHYDQTTTLNAAFLAPLDVIIFGLHQKVWAPAEKTALDSWIRSGGGILMYSDSAAGGKYNVVGIDNPTGQNAVNNILSPYGMQVTVDQGGGVRAYRSAANHSNPIVWETPGFDYTARNTRFTVQQKTNLVDGAWGSQSNWTESISIAPESPETEIATVRILPMSESQVGFSRVALFPAPHAAPTWYSPSTVEAVRTLEIMGSIMQQTPGTSLSTFCMYFRAVGLGVEQASRLRYNLYSSRTAGGSPAP